MAGQYVVLGALDVMVVVLAVHPLALPAAYAGYLDASFGVGSMIGAAAALRLVGASSLARPLCFAAAAWGLSFALLGSYPTLATALSLLAAAGLARAIVDTAGRALLARVKPLSRLGRVFGLLEGLNTGAPAIGTLLVPLFYDLGGVRLTLIANGVMLVAAVLVPLRLIRTADRHEPAMDGIRRLHGHPLFASLGVTSLEELPRDLVIARVPAGTEVVRQGEPCDHFYLIAQGEFAVDVEGREIRRLEPGEGFGEIALLRDVPRTATVTARSECVLYALGREPFLTAMGASPPRVSLPGHAEFLPPDPTDEIADTVGA